MRSNVQAVSACCNRNQALSARQWMILGLAFVAWGFFLSAGQALGQAEGYKSLPLNAEFVSPPDSGEPKDRRAESARRQRYSERLRLVNDIYKGSASFEDNQAAFDQWYNEVVFAQMAQDSDVMLEAMATNREAMFKQLGNASNAQAVNHLVANLAFNKFQEIATDNYPPASRLNAVVILGRLDQTIAKPRNVAPAPLAKALPVLLQYVQDGALPEYVRVGALWGIERHCRIDGQKQNTQIAAQQRSQVIAALLPLLGPKPDDRSQPVDYWMKRMAIRSLGALGELGNNAEVATALMGMMEQAEKPIHLRCEAARAYGGLRFADAATAQATKAASVIASLASVATQAELDYLDSEEQFLKDAKDYKSGSLGYGGDGGMSGPMGGPMGGGGESPGAGGIDPADPMGGGGGEAGPMGGEGGFPGGSGGFGGFGGMGQSADLSELPVYRFRLSQRRLMSNVYTLQLAFDTGVQVSPGLAQFTDEEVVNVSAALQTLMTGAQVGLNDKEDFNLNTALGDFRSDLEDSILALNELSGVEVGGSDPFEEAPETEAKGAAAAGEAEAAGN